MNIVVIHSKLDGDLRRARRFSFEVCKNFKAKIENFKYVGSNFGSVDADNIRVHTSETNNFDCTIFFSYIADNIIVVWDVINSVSERDVVSHKMKIKRRRNNLIRKPNSNLSKIIYK